MEQFSVATSNTKIQTIYPLYNLTVINATTPPYPLFLGLSIPENQSADAEIVLWPRNI